MIATHQRLTKHWPTNLAQEAVVRAQQASIPRESTSEWHLSTESLRPALAEAGRLLLALLLIAAALLVV